MRTHTISASMSRKANCYDNAHMESFPSHTQSKSAAGHSFANRAEARLPSVFEYVETFYNCVRLHGALGYFIPCGLRRLAWGLLSSMSLAKNLSVNTC
jgi:putative transposase